MRLHFYDFKQYQYMHGKEVTIDIESVNLSGELTIPENAKGIIIFSHGSGSGRLSPRNKMVAAFLHKNNFATLLFDLLTPEEDEVYENRFNVNLLSNRLISVTEWIKKNPGTKNLPIGYFGASTGAASALYSAAACGDIIKAIVSRGGRPDLAMDILHKVKTPVLLVVGGDDTEVIELNKAAFRKLRSQKKIYIVEGATHLFEEEGKLPEVARVAADWFNNYVNE